ncbi:MAG TPA: DUF4743 domain-containing protein [Gammaproteobacteria bacterium]|nr:DUF4743 domain-containing protein [Gammaproteobacteria bacterium]
MSYLQRIRACNNCSLDGLIPFVIQGRRYGFVSSNFAAALSDYPKVFDVDERRIALVESLATPQARTTAVAEVNDRLRRQGAIQQWNDELFDVKNDFDDPAVMAIERDAVIHYGLRAYGVHVNGLVEKADGSWLWVATRARDKPSFPGMLDHIVAGGQPAGLGLPENVIKEAEEEASIPAELAARARRMSRVTYCLRTDKGLKADTLFCFDLELPPDFTPRSNDGEVESFELLPLSRVAEIVRDTERFKPNCNLVIIDLLLRKGMIDDESLADALRAPLP